MSVEATLANGRRFAVPAGVSLLDAAALAGLALPHSCRTGRCGSCRALCTSGRAQHQQGHDSLTPQERADGWAQTCTDTALANVSLDVDDQAELASLRLLTLPARIASLNLLTPDVLELRLRLPPQHGLRFLPGQYLELIGPDGLRRAYSIANADAADGLVLHVRRVAGGAMSQFLFEHAAPNGLVRIQAPRGSFHLGDVAGLNLVWLATGTGIAPFKAMLEGLRSAPPASWPSSIHLLWGNRLPQDHYWHPEASPFPVQFTAACSRADATWTGARGHVHTLALAAAQLPDRVYACGSPAMIEAGRAAYLARGLSPRNFQSDAFVAST